MHIVLLLSIMKQHDIIINVLILFLCVLDILNLKKIKDVSEGTAEILLFSLNESIILISNLVENAYSNHFHQVWAGRRNIPSDGVVNIDYFLFLFDREIASP